MRILMLCPMISSSSFVTTYPMAKALAKKHEVTIVGPLFGREPFIHDNELQFEFIEPTVRRPVQLGFMSLIRKNRKRLATGDWDVVHAFKLLPHTGPVAAAAAKKLGKKFVLSLDDYDKAGPKNPLKKWILGRAGRAYRQADAITVCSRTLQQTYGGEVVYQVPNERLFSTYRGNPEATRKQLGINGLMVLYAGTFFDHKGIDILIKAVQQANRERPGSGQTGLKLVLAGEAPEHIRKLAGNETVFVGRVPMEEVAELTAACDIYAIPTKDTPYARAEIPAKIFEPMMMGKAIVASQLSDIPTILGGTGLLAEPGSVELLAGCLQQLKDEGLRKRLGAGAKKRFFENYDAVHTEKVLEKVYGTL